MLKKVRALIKDVLLIKLPIQKGWAELSKKNLEGLQAGASFRKHV